ncbi:MAG: P-II family nitrogen regulator [Pseudomonadota bacterium]
MRMITAIIRPGRYTEVRDALSELGVQGLTVTEVRGFGRQRGRTEFYRGAEYEIAETPKLRIDVVVPSGLEEAALDAISEAARTGKTGDGMVFTGPVTGARRIRTGEEKDDALR